MTNELLIIGGGPAGIEAAREATSLNWRVTLISEGPVGGRAGWHSLLPSKVWLAEAEAAQESGLPAPAEQEITGRVAEVKESWNGQVRAELEALGVTIVPGHATFSAPDAIVVRDGEGEEKAAFSGRPIILATGSGPFFPPALKPDGRRVLAPRFLSHLDQLPDSMLVVGAGATGCESAYLFNALGVEVTWIVDQFGILPLIYQPAGAALGQALAGQGVNIVEGFMVDELLRDEDQVTAVLADGSRHEAQMAFVAIGRRPDLGRLNLAASAIELDDGGGIIADSFGRTSNPLVYIAGDCDGQAMTANKAQAQARTAVRALAGEDPLPFTMADVVLPTYTRPQVAQVGDMKDEAGAAIKRAYLTETLKTHISGDDHGYIDVAFDTATGAVRGAAAVGPHAADIVAPVAMAIRLGASIDDLAAVYAAYPSLSELAFIAARS